MSALDMFEADLRFKVDIKCPSGQMEQRFLSKCFQFYDFHRTGTLEFSAFFKTLEKIGVIITKENAQAIFNQIISEGYEINGSLDYKSYAQKVYNPASYDKLDSQVHKPMSQSAYGDMYHAYNSDKASQHAPDSQSSPARSQTSHSRKTVFANITNDTLDDILHELRLRIRMRGARGFVGLQRQFKVTDTYDTGTVNQFEFCKILREYDLNLLDAQYQVLFYKFDIQKTGQIDYKYFMNSLMVPMNASRQKVVVDAFKALDSENTGSLNFEYIKDQFIAQNHPDVLSGKKGDGEVFEEFFDTFQTHRYLMHGTEHDPAVTLEEWVEYYRHVSTHIDDDEQFKTILNNVWNMDGNGIKYQGFTQDWSSSSQHQYDYDKKKLSPAKSTSSKYTEPYRLHPNNESDDNNLYGQKPLYQQLEGRGYHDNATVSNMQHEETKSYTTDSNYGYKPPEYRHVPKYQQILLDRLNEQLRPRGIKGYIGFTRQLKIFDTRNEGKLDLYEFKKAIDDYQLEMIEIDIENLFKSFSQDSDLSLDIGNFLQTLIPPMNKFRFNLVKKVFKFLDYSGEGSLDTDILYKAYDSSGHPDVTNFKKEREEVLMEFQESFSLNHNMYHNYKSENPVDFDEFLDYYTYVSVLYDIDSQFDIMISNTWNLHSNMNPAAIPYAGIPKRVTQVNIKERWLNDHHRAIIEGSDYYDYERPSQRSPAKSMQSSPGTVESYHKKSSPEQYSQGVYDYHKPAVPYDLGQSTKSSHKVVPKYQPPHESNYGTPEKSAFKASQDPYAQEEVMSHHSHQSMHSQHSAHSHHSMRSQHSVHSTKSKHSYHEPQYDNAAGMSSVHFRPSSRQQIPKKSPQVHIHSRYY